MKLTRDTLIIAVGLIIAVLLAGYFYYQSQLPTEEELLAQKYNRIATLTVVNQDLDPATVEQFQEQFDAVSTKFLRNPNDILVFFEINSIGRIKQDVGDFEGAEEAFLHAYSLDPGGYIINGNLANLYQYGLNDHEKAEQFYLDTLAIENIQEGNHYTYFAGLYELYYYRIENSVKSEALIERALEELPENTRVLALAAEHYKREDNADKARQMYERILEIDPSSSVAAQGLESL